jgi:hypothetical protein
MALTTSVCTVLCRCSFLLLSSIRLLQTPPSPFYSFLFSMPLEAVMIASVGNRGQRRVDGSVLIASLQERCTYGCGVRGNGSGSPFCFEEPVCCTS